MGKFLNWFKGLFSDAFKSFVNAAFSQAKQIVIAKLKDVAVQAVIDAQATGLDSDAKRKAVFDKIKAHAIKEGLEAKDSVIALTLEMAVSAVKG
jgi:hypothetical protein